MRVYSTSNPIDLIPSPTLAPIIYGVSVDNHRETTSYNNFKGKGYGVYTPNKNDGAISPMMSHQEADVLCFL